MATGEYISVSSQNEFTEAEVGVEQPRFGLLPEQVPALASLDMLGVVRQLLADLNGDVAGGGPRSSCRTPANCAGSRSSAVNC